MVTAVSFLRWLRRTAGDVLAGCVAAVLVSAALLALASAVSVVVHGPNWARFAVLVPVWLAILATIGRVWRRQFASRAQQVIHAEVADIHKRLDAMDAGRTGAAASVVPIRVSAESPLSLDARMNAKTDEELRAAGVKDPATMRRMGFMRYCAAAARVDGGAESTVGETGICRLCGRSATVVVVPTGRAVWAHDEFDIADRHDVVPGGWTCDHCSTGTGISHQSTFCKKTGQTFASAHWCCPGACELDDPATYRQYLRNAGMLDDDERTLCACQHVKNPPCSNCENGTTDPDRMS